MARAACVSVIVSAWQCVCRRCDHEWIVVCGCATIEPEAAPRSTSVGMIVHRCGRPLRCANPTCKSRSWQTDTPRKAGRPHGTTNEHKPFAYRTGSKAWKTKVWDEERELWIESAETFVSRKAAEATIVEEGVEQA